MPFVANTPESLLARSDSKDPNSTCRGITSAGRPCRRSVSTGNTPPRRRSKLDLSDESLYCWQHKEQAVHSAASSPGPKLSMKPIREERTSIDTLADRLGLVDLEEKKRSQPAAVRSVKRAHRYPDGFNEKDPRRPTASRKKQSSSLQLCCFSIPIDEIAGQPPRPRPAAPTTSPRRVSSAPTQHYASPKYQSPPQIVVERPRLHTAKSHTARLKSLISNNLPAATASALLTELARPYVDAEEPGYIYIFWLTPTNTAPLAAAQSLIDNSDSDSDSGDAASSVSAYSSSKTMLLKIGRAANVQRRMNQWQRQCGYEVQVLRYYPQAVSDGQTPHCKRVERLIHIELAGLGMKASLGSCKACGREHREWFEVEVKREAVRKVDRVIRRWIEWDLASNDGK